jgi:acyl-CoA thioesterase
VELAQADAGITATATAVFAVRRETWSHHVAPMPNAPAPETLNPLSMPAMMAWLKHYDFRFIENAPERLSAKPRAEPGSARSQVWISERQPRQLDFPALVAFADTFFARIFHVRGAMLPIGTVSMTTYFHGDAEDLATAGEAPLFGVADGRIFNKGFFDQDAELWSRDGRLLATSHQIVYFRE